MVKVYKTALADLQAMLIAYKENANSIYKHGYV